MIGKILCWLGFHKYTWLDQLKLDPSRDKVCQVQCIRCGIWIIYY